MVATTLLELPFDPLARDQGGGKERFGIFQLCECVFLSQYNTIHVNVAGVVEVVWVSGKLLEYSLCKHLLVNTWLLGIHG